MPDESVWTLNLDQIESGTGKILEKISAPVAAAKNSTHWFDERHVLYSKLRPYLNKVVLPDQPGLATTELVPLLPDEKRLDRKYLAYYLRSRPFVNWVSAQVAGAKMPRVNMKVFWEHKIPLPPLKEQKRIAAILDKADSLRRKRQQAIQLADQFLRAVFLDMFGDPTRNPMGWAVKSLGGLVQNLDGKRVPVKAADRKKMAGEYPYYGASGIIDYVDDYLFEGRNLLIGEDGANLLARSTPIAFIAEGKYWVNNHAHVLGETEHARLEYLMYTINRKSIADYVSGSAQPKLNQAQMNRIPIPVPPVELQDKFVDIISSMKEIGSRYSDSRYNIDRVFQSLTSKVFRG
ncbi:restriction endonuclease S subunits [Thiohalobacter thiocyanaticus]|uniref:Restriction endonuclease S subunits n=1 Tax=Thiohalobacter thiocyanaticus TaxID=585455 RepID=A0A1Z4VQY8_9GAMM|nr:restriction endonuclease subunit S [Thiohalobacter thiocyanaticus]BAZ93748.1 restriction endonuclease S subunits [Thiohalobacter thiocyanaticus]